MTRHSSKFAIALVCVVVLSAFTPTVASAQTDDDGSSAVSIVIDAASSPLEFAQGLTDRASLAVSSRFGDQPAADEEAESLRSHLATNEAAFVDHTNLVIDEYDLGVRDGTTTYKLTVEGDDTATIYLVTTGNGTDITGYSAVNETSNDVDESFTLTPAEAEALNEDVRDYKTDYVDENEVPDKGYYISKATKYGDRGMLP